ncbi:MAG TPA: hypothetical protein PLV83_04905 [Bacilli bacterium]|nr:hypothetical protein [Bacilli bacterium]
MNINDNFCILLESINNFKKTYNEYKIENIIDEKVIYKYVIDILSYFEMNFKFLKLSDFDDSERELINGFIYVNNVKKHSRLNIVYTINSKGLYPTNTLYPSNNLYPSDFGVYWGCLPFDTDKKHEKQNEEKFNCYNSKLKEQKIIETLDLLISFISKKISEVI